MTSLLRRTRCAALPLLFAGIVVLTSGCMQPQRTTIPGGGSAAIVMVNQTNAAIYYVYISSCSSSDWGQDRLGDSETVQPGATRTFTLSPGCWDLKARFADGREIEERQVRMTAGGSRTWTLSY